jgi:choline dehydrogenase-like flavoprotein
MIMIAGNLARSQQSMADVALGRIAVSVYQAFSQGYVRITTTDPEVDPAVEERMLSDPSDLVRLRDGVRRLRDICLQPGVTDTAPRQREDPRLLRGRPSVHSAPKPEDRIRHRRPSRPCCCCGRYVHK